MFARHELPLPLLLILCLLQLYSVKFVQADNSMSADKPMSAEEKEEQIVSFTKAIKAADPSKGLIHQLVLHFSQVKLDDEEKGTPSIYLRLYSEGMDTASKVTALSAREGWLHLPYYYESLRKQKEAMGLDTPHYDATITISSNGATSRTLTAVVPISATEWEQLEVTNGLAIVSGRQNGKPLTTQQYPNELSVEVSDAISQFPAGKPLQVVYGKYNFVFCSFDVDYFKGETTTHSVVHSHEGTHERLTVTVPAINLTRGK